MFVVEFKRVRDTGMTFGAMKTGLNSEQIKCLLWGGKGEALQIRGSKHLSGLRLRNNSAMCCSWQLKKLPSRWLVAGIPGKFSFSCACRGESCRVCSPRLLGNVGILHTPKCAERGGRVSRW